MEQIHSKHKNRRKTELIILLFATTILAVLCACGRNNTKAGVPGRSGQESQLSDAISREEDVSWRVSHTGLQGLYEVATMKEDRVYGCFFTAEGLKVEVAEAESGAKVRCHLLPEVTKVHGITVDAKDTICLLGEAEEENIIWQVSPEGEIRAVRDIEFEDTEYPCLLKGFYADDKGYYYLWCGTTVACAEVYEDGRTDVFTEIDRIYVKDQEMNTLCYEQVPNSNGNQLLSLLFTEEDIPLLLARDAEGLYTRRVRTEKQAQYEPCRLDKIDESVTYRLGTGEKFAMAKEGLVYGRDGALYLCRLSSEEEGEEEKLLELASGGIVAEDIIYLGARGKTIEIIDNYGESGRSEYTRFEAGAPTEKTRVTLGCLDISPEMRKTIAAFNRSQDQVRIEPVVYVKGNDFDAGYERLKLDVVSGKAPDLIDTKGIETEILAQAGAFMDLYVFMEKDPDCSREGLIPSVLGAYEMEGRLYTLAPSFYLCTMWGGKSLVQGRGGVSLSEMINILRENGGDINSIYGFFADESVLRSLCSLDMGEFIDWEEGTCNFTDDHFRQILDFAKQYQGPQYGKSLYGAIRKKEILLSLGAIASVEDYRLQSELYGEKVQFIGYPTTEGTGTAVIFSGNALAISTGTAHSAEAWEFMRYYLLHGYIDQGFPLVREQFEQVMREAMEEKFVKGEDGAAVPVCKIVYSERENDVNISVSCADRTDVDAVRELVDNVSGKFQYYDSIQNIIDEEAASFFSGQKTADEVMKIIQNRVQLYLDETRPF